MARPLICCPASCLVEREKRTRMQRRGTLSLHLIRGILNFGLPTPNMARSIWKLRVGKESLLHDPVSMKLVAATKVDTSHYFQWHTSNRDRTHHCYGACGLRGPNRTKSALFSSIGARRGTARYRFSGISIDTVNGGRNAV